MTDRQIEVMEKIREGLILIDKSFKIEADFPLLREFELIIKEEKELNYGLLKKRK